MNALQQALQETAKIEQMDISDLLYFNFRFQDIEDISLLKQLKNVKYLDLIGNKIVDLAPLESLTDLELLTLTYSNIRDLSPLEGLTCLEQEGLLSLQIIYNIFRQKLTTELLPQAKEKGVGLIVRLPLASGLLAGKFTKATTFHESDHRNYNKDGGAFNVGETFAGLPFEKGVELAEELKQYLPENFSMVDLALRWILDHDAVSTIIPGASKVDHQ